MAISEEMHEVHDNVHRDLYIVLEAVIQICSV